MPASYERVVGREVGAAGQAEYDVDALRLQALHDGIDRAHALPPLPGSGEGFELDTAKRAAGGGSRASVAIPFRVRDPPIAARRGWLSTPGRAGEPPGTRPPLTTGSRQVPRRRPRVVTVSVTAPSAVRMAATDSTSATVSMSLSSRRTRRRRRRRGPARSARTASTWAGSARWSPMVGGWPWRALSARTAST